MKLKCLFVFLTVCLMVSGVSAADWSVAYYWDSNNANWTADNPIAGHDTYWVDGKEGPPTGSTTWVLAHSEYGPPPISKMPDGGIETIIGRNIRSGIVSGGNVTVDSYIEWGASPTTTGNRMRIAGNATLNIVENGTLIGPGWLRLGESSMPNSLPTTWGGVARINQTGGELGLLAGGKDPTRLCISDGGSDATKDSDGIYYMTGGTLKSYGSIALRATNYDEGRLILGDRAGASNARLIIEGTAPQITMGMLYVGANYMSGCLQDF